MKVAIPHWQGRVSPVFDVAGRVLVVEFLDGVEHSRREIDLDVDAPQLRAAGLARAGADVLICGAISRSMQLAVSAAGIELIPQTCGGIEQVLAAFAGGRLQADAFLMPGCCGRGRGRGANGRLGRCRRRGGQPRADRVDPSDQGQ